MTKRKLGIIIEGSDCSGKTTLVNRLRSQLSPQGWYSLSVSHRSMNQFDRYFNEVRKPHNKTYHEVKALLSSNYQDIKKATTELSNLVGFSRILAEAVHGQAKQEILSLIEELNILS
ncbi:MAG: hypothetical protein ACX93T_03195 [Bacteroidota bacterium]